MTTYRLPDALGGAEVEITSEPGQRLASFRIPGTNMGIITLAHSLLVEVKPPLPPEPTVDGTFVTVESEGPKVYAYSRRGAVRMSMHPDLLPEYCWWWHDDTSWVSWAQVCAEGDPVVRVPDPAADAPELPWHTTDSEGTSVCVQSTRPGWTFIETSNGGGVWLTPDDMRTLAAVLLRRTAEVAS